VHVEDPDPPETLFGLQLTVIPPDGEDDSDRFTVPVKPFLPLIVAVKDPVPPDGKERLEGLVEMLKSCWPESRHAVKGWISQPL
jgi:hypothetical protein